MRGAAPAQVAVIRLDPAHNITVLATSDARRVDVSLVDKDRGEPQRMVEKRATVSGSTWKVSFRPGQLSRLDGRFRVSSLHTLTGETARIGGPTKFAIRKLR